MVTARAPARAAGRVNFDMIQPFLAFFGVIGVIGL
jgi:hypothetical protein